MAKITPKQRAEKRMEVYEIIKEHFSSLEEDIDLCVKGDSNTAILNFPTTINGEDAWVEIMVSIPTKEDYDGYEKRESYEMVLKNNAEKEKKKAEEKEKKIARDKKLREKKAKEKEE